jgi:biotin transport system substrate-specific component
MQIRQLAMIALFPPLIALLAYVTIPIQPVPITGQVIGVFLAAVLLGGKGGFLALLAYLLLGAAGLPVFSGGRGGLAILFGHTGGYLFGFLPGVYLAGRVVERRSGPGLPRAIAALLLCLGCTYLLGAVQLALLLGLTPLQAFLLGVAPYLPLDLAKIAITAPLALKVRESLKRNGLVFHRASPPPRRAG